MKPLYKLSLHILVLLLLFGCTTTKKIHVDKSLNSTNAGKIIVYRPSSAWIGLAIDYQVHLNENYIGSLETKKHIETYADPGLHTLTVENVFMGIGDKSFTTEVKVEAGHVYYMRFFQHLKGGRLELKPATYEQWKELL